MAWCTRSGRDARPGQPTNPHATHPAHGIKDCVTAWGRLRAKSQAKSGIRSQRPGFQSQGEIQGQSPNHRPKIKVRESKACAKKSGKARRLSQSQVCQSSEPVKVYQESELESGRTNSETELRDLRTSKKPEPRNRIKHSLELENQEQRIRDAYQSRFSEKLLAGLQPPATGKLNGEVALPSS